jgi:hypothetical protein
MHINQRLYLPKGKRKSCFFEKEEIFLGIGGRGPRKFRRRDKTLISPSLPEGVGEYCPAEEAPAASGRHKQTLL